MQKGEVVQISNFTFFHNVFYAISILESFNSHILVVFCSFFEFGTVLKWRIRELVKFSVRDLKVALQILGRKFYKNTEKSSLFSQSLLIFIRKTPVVESHPTTREIRDLLWPRSTPTGNTVYF